MDRELGARAARARRHRRRSRCSRWRSGPRGITCRSRTTRIRRSAPTCPKGMRGPFERARALLEEAESILEKQRERHQARPLREGARQAPRRSRRARGRDGTRALRRGGLRRRAREGRRRGRRAPRSLAQERGARVRRVDPRRDRRRDGAARVRRRGVQDPERLDDPDAAGRRSHLREQVHLRARDPVHAQAAVVAHAAGARRRDGLRVSRAPGAGLHQARDRAPGRQARGARRSPDHQRLGGAELLRGPVLVHRGAGLEPSRGRDLRRVPRGRGVPHALRSPEPADRLPGARTT